MYIWLHIVYVRNLYRKSNIFFCLDCVCVCLETHGCKIFSWQCDKRRLRKARILGAAAAAETLAVKLKCAL